MFWKRGDKISITSLGGVNYVGHVCFLYNNVVVDCGIKPQTHEERKLNPDSNWIDPPPRLDILDDLLKRGEKAIGIITHAHLDHIGAVRELGQRKIPVYLSRWSKFFMERYEENLAIPLDAEFHTFDGNKSLKHGDLEISFIPVQHSIPGTHAVLIRLGKKSILHLGDFKFNGMKESLEESRKIFREIKNRVGRINCLVLDVLNVEMEGFTPPEQLAIDSIGKIIREAKGRVIITFFSSNIRRMEEILKIAKSQRKAVGVSGWGGMFDSYSQLTGHRPFKCGDIILIGGSQGEENSGLAKLLRDEHRFLRLSPRDTVVYSSRCIPGNEEELGKNIENLHRRRATIFLHEGEAKKIGLAFGVEERPLHFSGHGYRGDQQEAIEILDPEVIVPFHAPPEKCELFEEFVGGNKTKLLQVGETLEV